MRVEISMSLDGFVAGPTQTVEKPLGESGERLHEWMIGLDSWRERHGLGEGTRGPRSRERAKRRATGTS